MMRFIVGTLAAGAFLVSPLAAQQHGLQAQPDSGALGHPCAMAQMHGGAMHGMMGAGDSAGMKGMHGMMGMMAGDSAMMASMRFGPRAVLAHGDVLALIPEQASQIEALTHEVPDPALTETMHMQKMHQAAAKVRGILTPEQRAQVERLPVPCPMMEGAPADSAKAGHEAHHQ